ncbi:hypothetical protein KP78_20310 [Jeotgalibacillus soli]|uniref:Uncharacterized protein n=1 Tax=Jeotgalibacillus soli TaxID=889306 RepID=A0A0C2V9P7_9BACL|nr:hypothetical protein KP78_20310 [Jeotgalibacillus soli]
MNWEKAECEGAFCFFVVLIYHLWLIASIEKTKIIELNGQCISYE